jgi:hypothetical protein
LAVSDDGRWIAVADEVRGGKVGQLRRLDVLSIEAQKVTKQDLLDRFKQFERDLGPAAQVSRIAFDHEARTLVVGFEGNPLLLAFGLDQDAANQNKIDYKKPVRGWALGAGGRIAAVTEQQVFLPSGGGGLAPGPRGADREIGFQP